MPGSWTLLALCLTVVLLLIAGCLWLTLQGSAGARARRADTAPVAPGARPGEDGDDASRVVRTAGPEGATR